jgi:hypothetical protein
MDMEITRLANASWLHIPDRQVFAIRAVWLCSDGSRTQPNAASGTPLQRVPVLDWPPTLFEEAQVCH